MAVMSIRKDPETPRRTWHITDMATAMVALTEILALEDENGVSRGYRGAPVFGLNSQVIGLEINGPNTHAEARIGDVLVEDIGIRAFTADVHAAHFNEDPEV